MSGLSEEVITSASLGARCSLKVRVANFQLKSEICRPALADRLILWPAFKVATALDSLSAIIKHEREREESGSKKDPV